MISSRSTTPNENSLDRSVNFPLDTYSGAKYLKLDKNLEVSLQQLICFLLHREKSKKWRKISSGPIYVKI